MTSELALPPGRWVVTLSGLGLLVFAVVALSGPGRIDIVDGQTRFEAGRSLVEHGDSAIRDPRIYFSRFPGRDGLDFTNYRFPQTLVAVAAIEIADATGPATEGWRHFVFSLHGAVACALIAVLFAVHFRRTGLAPRAAVGWAAAGIFCTPCWYYGTSTYDDILGSACVVAMLVAAARAGAGPGYARAAAVGLLLGLAYNCKQPLATFLLPALALADNRALGRPARLARAGLDDRRNGLGTSLPGLRLVQVPRKSASHGPIWSTTRRCSSAIRSGLAGLRGRLARRRVLLVLPPLVLCLYGLKPVWDEDRRLVRKPAVPVAAFVGFVSLITFYKGTRPGAHDI